MIDRIQIGLLAVLLLLGPGACIGTAGVFAHGGGESRTISSVAPDRTYNAGRQPVVLTGNFSRNKGDRRVVLSGPGLLGPIPVAIGQWRAHNISVTLPNRLTPGIYKLSLERFSNRDNKWHTISNFREVTVIAGAVPQNRDGSPHGAPITLVAGARDSICSGPPIRVWVDGGPFQRNGRPYPIRAELRAPPLGPGRLAPPEVSIVSPTRLMVRIDRCQMIYPDLALRLSYPDGSASNWISVADPQIAGLSHPTESRSLGQPQRLRAH